MPPPIDEYQLHRAFYQWCVGWPDRDGNPTKPPALLPGVEVWHTANGGERRDAFEGKRLREIGVTAGIHDLLFLRPTRFTEGTFGLLFGLEFKKPGARRIPLKQRSPAALQSRAALIAGGYVEERLADALSDAQLLMHPRLLRAGLAASVVVDSLEAAREWSARNLLTSRF